ncbi:uncharacterized protein V6R79_011507 [Siganus canaliculatus]
MRQQVQIQRTAEPFQHTESPPSIKLNPSSCRHTADGEIQMVQKARQKIQRRLELARLFLQYRARGFTNKYGVAVISDPESTEEKILLTVYENQKVLPLTVKNFGISAVYLTLRAFNLVSNIFFLRDCDGNVIESITHHVLGPGEAYKINVHFYSEHAGLYEQILVFMFEACHWPSDKFEIVRLVEITHRTSFNEEAPPISIKLLCEKSPVKWSTTKRIRFIPPPLVVPLKRYVMPASIEDFEKNNLELQKPLDWNNYTRRFHLLLHLEEFKRLRETQKYNQNDVQIFRHKSNGDLFLLQIAGFPMKSSSRLCADQVFLTPSDQTDCTGTTSYKGWVHHLNENNIYLKMDDQFANNFVESMRFNVNFIINRIPLRLQHRAVALMHRHKLKEVLFPTGQLSSHHSRLPRLPDVEGNPEQLMAIQHIVATTAKPAPYLVFGPPGTGKTLTLVEAIKWIVRTQASCHILACAPSNSAADHLCEKLLVKQIGQVYRLYSLSYPIKHVLQHEKLCCNLDHETKTFTIPLKEELMQPKVLVTTLVTAGRLVSGGIHPGHYTHIFVDEVGQASETECLISIAGLMKLESCQVVLAGDPKQMGPVITCTTAVRHGLGVSLLERLMSDFDIYKSHETLGFNNRFITKLLRNYRSRPAILKIPNELFYEGELQAHAQIKECNSCCKWKYLPKKGFPVIFHGVAGTDERDANSPSVYNMAEVEVLKEYLKALLEYHHQKGVAKIGPEEIGIITPYRKQVQKIQHALYTDRDLRKENLKNIMVGTVEKFQGKEFNAVLVSAVRSIPKVTAEKQRITLGFVDDEKEFKPDKHSRRTQEGPPGQRTNRGTARASSISEKAAERKKKDPVPSGTEVLMANRSHDIIDESGIRISSSPPFVNGELRFSVDEDEYTAILKVENTAKHAWYLNHCTVSHHLEYFTLKDKHGVTGANALLLLHGDSHEIQVLFRCSLPGTYATTLTFAFEHVMKQSSGFQIKCPIEAQRKTAFGREPKLLPIPSSPFCNLLKKKMNYFDWFHLLLYLKEQQMEKHIKRYNIPNAEKEYAVLTRDPQNVKFLFLELPNLSENRPSVLQGDTIRVYPIGEKEKYDGSVHSVERDGVWLDFSKKFLDHFKDSMKFGVEFEINRLTLRLQHRALDLASSHRLRIVLLPDPQIHLRRTKCRKLRLFDERLNQSQSQAVQHIVAGSSKPAPYLVFGPPGTGKTVTLAEAIKQIQWKERHCHILACAHTNVAADLLAINILDGVDGREVFRMYAKNVNPSSVPQVLKQYSNLEINCSKRDTVMGYKIIVTTLFTAGRLVTANIPEGHFTHVFIDEAGYAMEPECLIPLAGLLDPESGQVVLAGDPKQLGPIVTSHLAQKGLGLGVSLLERLMRRRLYLDKYSQNYVTTLCQNYRSHPAILEIPNRLFYENNLQFMADKKICNSYCAWEHLPKTGFPLIFHGVIGDDKCEANSPSFFNEDEVKVLEMYVEYLLQTAGKMGLDISDIGIITPYRKQVQKIREALDIMRKEGQDTSSIKVGSVEEFQGQEKKVILISTVRSSHNDSDEQFNLGFVRNEKRFNVAVTRAKALLIVVGNPRMLSGDGVWKEFICYCKDKGGYTGVSLED